MADPMTWLSSTEALLLATGIGSGLVLGYFMFPTMRQAKRRVIELEQTRQDADLVRQELDQTTLDLSQVRFELEQARIGLEQAREDLDEVRAELAESRREHDRYRGSVSDHFVRTADLVGEMTRSYAAVYDHLAGGAQNFAADSFRGKAVAFGPSPAALVPPVDTASADPEGEAAEEAESADEAEARTEDATDVALDDTPGEALAETVLDDDAASLDSSWETTSTAPDDFEDPEDAPANRS